MVVAPLPPGPPPAVVAQVPVPETIFDSVDVTKLPPGGIYLAYVDGRFVTLNKVRARYPTSRILTVSVTGASKADVLDFEPGDVQSGAIARWWVESGDGDTIYSDLSDKPLLNASLAGLSWHWFAADPTGCTQHLVPGSVATQYCWHGTYDVSVTNGTWPVAPISVSQPTATVSAVSPLP